MERPLEEYLSEATLRGTSIVELQITPKFFIHMIVVEGHQVYLRAFTPGGKGSIETSRCPDGSPVLEDKLIKLIERGEKHDK